MRKFLIPLMAATMLAPAAAQAEEDGVVRAMRDRVERSSQSDDDSDNRRSRAERSEQSNRDRPARVERAPGEERAPRVERVQRTDRVSDDDHAVHEAIRIRARDARRAERDRRTNRDAQPVDQVQVNEPAQGTPPTERRRGGLAGAFTGIGRDMADGRGDERGDRDNDRDWRRDRDGDRDWRRDRDGRHRWDRDWRRDRRYDWSNYRNRYRSIFRLGRYYDPYGWGYRRFSIGFSLWPSYYGSSFWLNDPWQYRLPPAYGTYRWVRYFDDALLVDIYTGRVVDVVHNVFW